MGYGLAFGWLSTAKVTFRRQATEILSHIPLRLRLALSPRSSLGESSTTCFALRSE